MLLSDAPKGASFKVVKVTLRREVGKRLADMGFTENTEGAVVRSGFFRGPLQVRIRGYDILIRRYEAAGIEVEPVGNWSAAADGLSADGPPVMRRVKKQKDLRQHNERPIRAPCN
ncbi:MAG: ferrous iron transport protein A [Treponema sp.]|jgi:ferrous iron transport protein A|nr:ferrous iron transport protein A [Treponema sp.]